LGGGNSEELVLDFGLNTQMSPQPTEAIKLSHRLVMNFFTAKRLLGALHMAIQQHENVYGQLEIDVQKRLRGSGVAGMLRPAAVGLTEAPSRPKSSASSTTTKAGSVRT
jgi:Protein of unknown function (DUF3467)